MTATNRGKTNANQQIVNINLNGLDLEKVISEESKGVKPGKRRGGLAAELKRSAKQHQSAKDAAERRGVQIPQHLAIPPERLLDATTTSQIQSLSDHLTNSAIAIRQLSAEPYKRVGDFGEAIKRTNPMTAEELAAASAKAAADRAAAAAVNQDATDQAAGGTPAQQVDSAVKAATDWLALGVESVLGNAASGLKLAQAISDGSTLATRLVMLRDEAAVLNRLPELDDLHEAVFQHSVALSNGLAGVEATTQNTVLLLTSIEDVAVAFGEMMVEYERNELTLPEARDGVILLLGSVKQLSQLITQTGGDGAVAAIVEIKETMLKSLEKLNETVEQSAVKTRILAHVKKMKALLEVWKVYGENTPEVEASAELSMVLKSIRIFIKSLTDLSLDPYATEDEFFDLLAQRRIVTDVGKFYTTYNRVYYATVLGMFASYKNTYQQKAPIGHQTLAIQQFEPAGPLQFDREYAVYSGNIPLGPRDMVMTEFGIAVNGSAAPGNTIVCELGSGGNRRGLESCALLPGIDSPPPVRPQASSGIASWTEYRTALDAWAEKYRSKLPDSQKQDLQRLRGEAIDRVEAGGSQPPPQMPDGSEVPEGSIDGVVPESWPTWTDGTKYPAFPTDDASVQEWQKFKQETTAYMTDKDDLLNASQFAALNGRVARAEAMIAKLGKMGFPTMPIGAVPIGTWRAFKQQTRQYMIDNASTLTSELIDELNARIGSANAAIESLLPSTPAVPGLGGSDTDLSGDGSGWTEEADDERVQVRRDKIMKYLEALYYTERGYDDSIDIIYQELLDAYNEPKRGKHILMYTNEDIALGKAVIIANQHVKKGDEVKFVQEATNMPNAVPMYALSINNQIAKQYDGNSNYYFTQYGDVYSSEDLKGVSPSLIYPFRNISRDNL